MYTPSAAVPARPQHLCALERANAVRVARAELKRRVARGDVDAVDVVLSPPWEADTMPVGELLMSQRRWGSSRARKILARLSMSETKSVGSMTDRQRLLLASLLAPSETPAVLPRP
jgi:hypothetical protein